jgi:hypothetical protein
MPGAKSFEVSNIDQQSEYLESMLAASPPFIGIYR